MSAFVYQTCAEWSPVSVPGLGAGLLLALGAIQVKLRIPRPQR